LVGGPALRTGATVSLMGQLGRGSGLNGVGLAADGPSTVRSVVAGSLARLVADTWWEYFEAGEISELGASRKRNQHFVRFPDSISGHGLPVTSRSKLSRPQNTPCGKGVLDLPSEPSNYQLTRFSRSADPNKSRPKHRSPAVPRSHRRPGPRPQEEAIRADVSGLQVPVLRLVGPRRTGCSRADPSRVPTGPGTTQT